MSNLNPSKFALEIKHVSKTYASGLRAVENLSFNVAPGEICGLLGPNGAGKSTLIGMICGLVRISGGSISVFGADVEKQYQRTRSQVGFTPQEVAIENFFVVDEALKIHSGYFGRKDDPAWRELLIEKLDLGPHLQKKPMELSGGMKRRLMIAKSLIHRPRLLILDEPTAGVDVELRRGLWTFVRELRDQGMTILLTTHYLEEAEALCERLAIINNGQLVALDTTQAIMANFGKGADASLEDVYIELTQKGGDRV